MRRQSRMYALLTIFVLFLAGARSALGAKTNVTIDDQYGDETTNSYPIYSGQGADTWQQGSTCTSCAADGINSSKTERGTWHDSTASENAPASIQMTFTGSAMYAFFILANDNLADGITAQTSMTLTIDGELVQNYTHTPSSATDYTYNASALTSTGLVNTNHTVVIESTGSQNSLILFDYLVYTSDPDTVVTTTSSGTTTSASSSTSAGSNSGFSSSSSGKGSTVVGPVVGAIIGALALAVLVLVGFLCRKRFRRKRMERAHIDMIGEGEPVSRHPDYTDHADVQPFYSPVPTTISNPYSNVPTSSVAASRNAPVSSVEPPSSDSAPSMPASSMGNTQHSERDTNLRSQVDILMNELANMRAQQALQRGETGMYNHNNNEGEAPPPDYMSDGRRSPDTEDTLQQRITSRETGLTVSEKTPFRNG